MSESDGVGLLLTDYDTELASLSWAMTSADLGISADTAIGMPTKWSREIPAVDMNR